MKIGILCAGMVGRTIAADLSQHFDVTSMDISPKSLELLSKKNPNVTTREIDLTNYDYYKFYLNEFDLVVNAVPGFMGYKSLEHIIKAGKNCVDISFFPENTFDLHDLAVENNVTVISDCGVAPGLSNLVLGYFNSKMKIDSFSCYVGGLPKVRTLPWQYKAPFSPVDVLEEYTRPSRLVENGVVVTKPAMSDLETIETKEVGTLEAFNTDGLRSILFTMGHIKNMKEKTLRWPGHVDLIEKLKLGGFFSKEQINGIELTPFETTSKILINQWKLDPKEEEFTIMRIDIKGHDSNGEGNIRFNLYDEYDEKTGTSSMSRTTGYMCSAGVNLLLNDMWDQKGVFTPETIGSVEKCYAFMMEYLQKRNIKTTVEWYR